MHIEKSINIAEIIGVVAVVLSLAFVGFELRHANRLAEAEAVQSINEMIAEKLNATASSQWSMEQIAAASDQPLAELGFRFERISWMNIYEAAWISFDNGIIDRTQLDAYMRAACWDVFRGMDITEYRWPGLKTWDEWRGFYNPGYVVELEKSCTGVFKS